jgi:hypothetical protein
MADLSPAECVMLDCVAMLTIDSAAVEQTDVAAYYAYVNQVGDGLGVELEPFWEASE